MKTHNYLNLSIWKESIDFAIMIYETTQTYRKEERYGLVDQLRRAAYSIPSNIAEGSKRSSDKDFNRFLGIAQGSLAEVHTQLIISNHIGQLMEADLSKLEEIVNRLRNMIYKFQKALKQTAEE
jgi:four helix bundle protein